MGDRCYVSGTVKKEDWPRFKEITEVFEKYDQDFAPELVEFEDEQANYGLYDECCQAASEKLTFILRNSAGDNYGKGVYVSLGDGKLHGAELGDGGNIMVPIRSDGTIDPVVLASAMATNAAEDAVLAMHPRVPDMMEE